MQTKKFDFPIVLITLIIASPIMAILWLASLPSDDIWKHLYETVLFRYTYTTCMLMIGVGGGTLLLGVSSAWLVTCCEFTGRRFFEWAALLPMAIPAYIIAFIYTDLLEYSGSIQEFLRYFFSWNSPSDYWFPEIRSLWGAIFMMTFVLYPYVYLLSRVSFADQSSSIIEVSRTLGRGPWNTFFKISIPLARPSLVIGVSLVLMEVLNDFGTVDFFAIETFTAGIYDVWMNMDSISGASQLSVVLLFFVLLLLFTEKWGRRKQKFSNDTKSRKSIKRYYLHGYKNIFSFFACIIPIFLGFFLPSLILIRDSFIFYDFGTNFYFFKTMSNSFILSFLSAITATLIGIFLGYGQRVRRNKFIRGFIRFSSIGYAIPGSVLAVGIIISFGKVDEFLNFILGMTEEISLSGTLVVIIYAYSVRFLALSFGSIESSLTKVTPNMDAASRTLGMNSRKTLFKVHIPIIKKGVLASAILVFVDCMKELPMTLVLRPFNFETLSTNVYQFASDELFEESALSALAIVLTGVIPIIILSKIISSGSNVIGEEI
ncbi:MAG: iron ABC transporter permease [Nitrospinota bacterium]|nr:iron ABC transporter permease [Nitrospinota bacterium]